MTTLDYIKKTFERVAKDVPIDAALLKRIHLYERAFVNRSNSVEIRRP